MGQSCHLCENGDEQQVNLVMHHAYIRERAEAMPHAVPRTEGTKSIACHLSKMQEEAHLSYQRSQASI